MKVDCGNFGLKGCRHRPSTSRGVISVALPIRFSASAATPECCADSHEARLGFVLAAALDQASRRDDKFLVRTAMTRRQPNSSAVSLTAAVAMFLWLLGQTLCLQHCARLTFAKGGQDCCAKKSEGHSKRPAGEGKMTCGSLKIAKLETKTLVSEVAALPVPLLAPAAFLVLRDTTADLGLQVHLRTLPRADFVFLPEVSLGAALRSLAPPARA